MAQLPDIWYGEYGKAPKAEPWPHDDEEDLTDEELQDVPVSQDFIDILGFDPAEIDWSEDEDDNEGDDVTGSRK